MPLSSKELLHGDRELGYTPSRYLGLWRPPMHATIVNDDTQLPEELRRALNLRPGQAVALIPVNGMMTLVPVPTLDELCGVLEGVDTSDIRDRDER